METLVGIDQEITQIERRFFDSREKDGANPVARRRSLARGRADCVFQSGAATERANRDTRADQQFKEPEKQLQPFVATIENVAARNQKLHPELAFELILGRDDLLDHVPQLRTTHVGLTLVKLISDEESRLISILPKLPAAKEKRILQALPAALGERWSTRALRLMQAAHGRMVAQTPHVFSGAGRHEELRA